jgi:hypothetical protein
MPLNIIADFFNLINITFFDIASVVLVISFIVWEAPRSFKLMPEEYSRDLYPENGRVADFLFFAIGLSSVAFFLLGSNAGKIVSFLKTPGVTALFLILMVSIPLIVALGFVKRFFTRIDKHESVAIFLVHALLDLAHTLFYVSLLIMSIPALGFLLMGK